MRMDGKSCMSCECCHFTDTYRTTLYCVPHNFHPKGHNYCEKYYKEQESEKLVLSDEFVRVIKLLRNLM